MEEDKKKDDVQLKEYIQKLINDKIASHTTGKINQVLELWNFLLFIFFYQDFALKYQLCI